MKPKVERIARDLSEILKSWSAVECVAVCEQSETDTLDPYFALALDVYYRGAIPDIETRSRAFGEAGAFESGRAQNKDRFFLEGLPIRVEYKNIDIIERCLSQDPSSLWLLPGSGTYLFYRLVSANILWERSDWMQKAREELKNLPDAFWTTLRAAFQAKMEHNLSDLGAAAFQDDGFFYLVSLGAFLRYASATLFMINHQFEPSHRDIEVHLYALPIQPSGLRGNWENLVRFASTADRNKRFKIAELLAKSIIDLE